MNSDLNNLIDVMKEESSVTENIPYFIHTHFLTGGQDIYLSAYARMREPGKGSGSVGREFGLNRVGSQCGMKEPA